MKYLKSQKTKLNAKRVFMKKGTCSRTFFYILNREFGSPNDLEETAADPLAGGIAQQGYQCGMLWGSAFALGSESFKKSENLNQAIGMAVHSTQKIMESFVTRTKSIECSDVTSCDFKKKFSLVKFMLTGKFLSCFKLAGKWAPEAIDSAREGLSADSADLPKDSVSCASEVVKKMGGGEREMSIVSGLAGGLGLSGSGCGALAAAIWMNTFNWLKKENWKYSLSDKRIEGMVNKFYEATEYEMECSAITGKKFKNLSEHTDFIKNGGCSSLIDLMAKAI